MPRVPRALIVACMLLGCGIADSTLAQETPVFGSRDEMDSEQRLRDALRRPVTLAFDETPLREVAAELEKLLGIQIAIDTRALEDAGLDADTPVTFRCEHLSARQALRMMLTSIDLAWVNQQVLVITTRERADEELRVRIYPVADLINDGGVDGQDAWFGHLIDVIHSTVAAETWDVVGGQGAIRPISPAASLVISQTEEVHEKIEGLLFAIRAARQAQGLSPLALRAEPSDEARQAFVPAKLPVLPSWQRPQRHE